MRITQNLLMDRYLFNQNKISKKNYELQNQLATNSKIDTISDDLSTSIELINLHSHIKKNGNFKENIVNAREYANTTARSFDSIVSEIQNIIVEVQNSVNPSNEVNFGSINEKVKNSLSAIVQALNEKHNDMYVFGGTNFQTEPFGLDADGKATVDSADLVGKFNVQIGPSTNETMNITGDKIVSSNILTTINSIVDSFTNSQVPDQTLRDNLDAAYKSILSLQSSNGNKINKLDDMESMLDNQTTDLNELFVNKQSIDTAAVMVDLQNQEYLLELSYKLASTILPKSLLDYL